MTFDKKKIALIVIGGVLALSFLVFLVLFAKYDRGGDPNNEDALLKLAHKDPFRLCGVAGRALRAWKENGPADALRILDDFYPADPATP